MKKLSLCLVPQPVFVQPVSDAGFDVSCLNLKPEHKPTTVLDWADYAAGLLAEKQNRIVTCRTLTEWVSANGALPLDFKKEEGYVLTLAAAGIQVAADTKSGFRNAAQTLAQLLFQAAQNRSSLALHIFDWPRMERRCAHICYHLATDWMPESVPNFSALKRLLKLLAHFKYNAILLEIEAMFPHQKHPAIAAKNAFTPAQIAELGSLCSDLGLEIMPLLQSLGHAYHVLSHSQYAHLREVPNSTQQYCPSNPDVLPFYLELAEEIWSAFPGVKRFHIGGDESRRLGECPACAAVVKSKGVGALYGKHVGAVARSLLEKGLTPLIWTDMIEHHPDAANHMPEGTEFVYWKYVLPRNGNLDFQQFMRRGTVWAAAGIRFGTCNHTMYRYPEAMQGISFLTSEAQRSACANFIVTDWMKAIPFELSEPGYAYAAECSWGARRSQNNFLQAYICLVSGADAQTVSKATANLAALLEEVFQLLSFPLIPFCEDAQRRQVLYSLDRYDLSGLTFRTRLEHLLSTQEQKALLESLRTGWEQALKAGTLIRKLQQSLPSDWRVGQLLELGALTNAHKAELGMTLAETLRVLKFPLPADHSLRKKLTEKLRTLMKEHQELSALTEQVLAPVMLPEHLAANLKIKFEPAAYDWMNYFKTMLEKGTVTRSVLGNESVLNPN